MACNRRALAHLVSSVFFSLPTTAFEVSPPGVELGKVRGRGSAEGTLRTTLAMWFSGFRGSMTLAPHDVFYMGVLLTTFGGLCHLITLHSPFLSDRLHEWLLCSGEWS